MTYSKKIIGTKEFKEIVTVTDPCYDNDTGFTVQLKVKPGKYACIVWLDENKEVALIGIYLNGIIPQQKIMEYKSDISVDSGLAGFFMNKPNYDDSEWSEFVKKTYKDENKKGFIIDEGFYTRTGGDGMFSVLTHKDRSGEIDAVEVQIINE